MRGFGGRKRRDAAFESKKPAKKPLSQVRCSGVNGALSGISVRDRRDVAWLIRRLRSNMVLSASTSWRRVKARKLSSRAVRLREIGLEHPLDRPRRVLGLDVAIDLAADRGLRAEAAADLDVIALDRVAVLGGLHLAGQQPDIADVMLRAGIRAAGEMDVDRAVERTRVSHQRAIVLGVALGIGQREPAAGIAGAGDEPGADRIRLGRRDRAPRSPPRRLRLVRRHAGDQQVLPDREADVAVAEFARDLGDPAHLRRP